LVSEILTPPSASPRLVAERGDRLPVVGAALVAALVAGAFFLWTFPLDFLLGHAAFWDNPGDDSMQARMGYLAFAKDAWRFPLFLTKLMNPPDGVNIIFTDGIPFLALIGKVIYKFSGATVNYFGAWMFFCYLAQGVAGVLIARALNIRSVVAMAAVGVIFVFTPSFLFRHVHPALCGHFLILLSIVFYLRTVAAPAPRLRWAFLGMVLLTLLINAYVFAMVGAIYLASLTEAARRGTLPVRQALGAVALLAAGTALLAILSGGQQAGSAVGIVDGFGVYSMNLLSPFWPQLSRILPWGGDIIDATGGQGEGYNYLGLGVLLLVALAILLSPRAVLDTLSRHRFLAVAMLVLTAYALSFDIWAGSAHLTHADAGEIPIFSAIAGTFRSSGRFFWPVGYVLLAGAVALAARGRLARIAPLLLAAAAIIQAYDATGVRPKMLTRLDVLPLPLDKEIWGDVIARHKAVLIAPHFVCMKAAERRIHRELLFLAAAAGVPANSAIVNRLDVDCGRERDAVLRDPFAEPIGSPALHLFMKAAFPPDILSARPAGARCVDTPFAYVCTAAAVPGFPSGTTEFRPITGGTLRAGIDFADAAARKFMGAGWSVTEGWGTWAVGERAELALPLDAPVAGDIDIAAEINPFSHGDYLARRATIYVNGERLTTIMLDSPDVQRIEFDIPQALAAKAPVLAIAFVFEHPKSPRDVGLNADDRPLSWGFKRVSLIETRH